MLLNRMLSASQLTVAAREYGTGPEDAKKRFNSTAGAPVAQGPDSSVQLTLWRGVGKYLEFAGGDYQFREATGQTDLQGRKDHDARLVDPLASRNVEIDLRVKLALIARLARLAGHAGHTPAAPHSRTRDTTGYNRT